MKAPLTKDEYYSQITQYKFQLENLQYNKRFFDEATFTLAMFGIERQLIYELDMVSAEITYVFFKHNPLNQHYLDELYNLKSKIINLLEKVQSKKTFTPSESQLTYCKPRFPSILGIKIE